MQFKVTYSMFRTLDQTSNGVCACVCDNNVKNNNVRQK